MGGIWRSQASIYSNEQSPFVPAHPEGAPRARLRQATRIVRANSKNLSRNDLMPIEAEDILASRVFEDGDNGGTPRPTARTGTSRT